MAKKHLRKNEFRDYTNPQYLSRTGKPHPAYISARYKRRYKANVITHSSDFFNKATEELSENPNRNSERLKDCRPSRVSVQFWDNEKNFSKEKLKGWRFSKKDKIKVKKWNKKNQP